MAIVAALTTAMLLLVPGPWPVQAAAGNILLLIADDFGVDLAGFYAVPGRVETTPPPPPTPNLTALARQGVLFPRAWASPTLSPTRAGILTGRYGFRTAPATPNGATCRSSHRTRSRCPRSSAPRPPATGSRTSANGT